MRRSSLVFAAPLAALALALAVRPTAAADSATASIRGPEGSSLAGAATFTRTATGVHVNVELENAPPGVHGFHLHDQGDCSAPDFTSAGGHFNPTHAAHGGPDAPIHHAGDFGNITVGPDGRGRLELDSTMLTVAPGPNSVLGKAVILHEKADDLTSQPTGAAGARIGCGVVR
jgi:Cu-Zn family superoxide dismutase